MVQRTLGIIKPDAVERNLVGEILRRIEDKGFKIKGLKMVHLTKEQAKKFYEVHKEKPFYESLTDYMSSGPIVVFVIEGEDVINGYRELMGATDPNKAKEGTIRKEFGLDVEKNSVHGSDSPENAVKEISFFFNSLEVF